MKQSLTDSQWQAIRNNPTLYRDALLQDEQRTSIPWHSRAADPKSSQIFCVSAFGTLRRLAARNQIIHKFLVPLFTAVQTPSHSPREWEVRLEEMNAELLGEFGVSQPTSIDAMLTSKTEVICIESKFIVDAKAGLGCCNQVRSSKKHAKRCLGFYGPGSDVGTKTKAWCRLETWEKRRSPRLYWLLGRQYFRPEHFRQQAPDEICILRDGNYQLMRNFLSAAMWARARSRKFFGVLVIAPSAVSAKVRAEVDHFRERVLMAEFRDRVVFTTYETYIGVLNGIGMLDASELALFLTECIARQTASAT